MKNWMLRGSVFAAAMVVVRLVQGALINAWQTQSGPISLVLLLLFVSGVVVWGAIDGRADAKANRDPDRREDLAMTWLLAGLASGLVGGALAWVISAFYPGIYTGGLLNEVTTFAAFTALVVFVFAISGVSVGRWVVDRQYEKEPVRHHGLAAQQERGDTDVFTAVRADESPTGEMAVPAPDAQAAAPTSVATVEREAPTEVIRTAESEEPTEVIRLDEDQTKKD
ncbi:B-4DMT family transporter [Mycobacterium shinjukuense]|uniref:Uncharacterized protein n=1 Tax=Mycobacterium shinjukuense TaxID=398694 RepID=A0A7I7MP05_9MYCO|nr:B-4DMT family transporter [Mycobacterium shinjukuense]MCV6986417.1 B-4DMT family transporter [Mycobacterium shinjukuense]ORB68992.1 hypothetical protein BST45_10960 [Mycobacterium shinjukuense]BBX73971.1 hypothetical protein MSHI_18770 [Mycobacterium shinjukuense]